MLITGLSPPCSIIETFCYQLAELRAGSAEFDRYPREAYLGSFRKSRLAPARRTFMIRLCHFYEVVGPGENS